MGDGGAVGSRGYLTPGIAVGIGEVDSECD